MQFLNLILIFVAFFGLFLSIAFQFKNVHLIKIIAGIFSILIVFEIISFWSLGVWIGYEFLSNFHWNLIVGFIFDFKKEVVFAILLFFLIFLIFVNSIKIYLPVKKVFKILILVISLLILSIPSNPLAKIIEYIEISFIKTQDFKKYLPDNFTQLSSLKAQAGKNIIFISIESLEKNFLDKRYGDFTYNLNKLKNDYNFYPMKQDGAGWTSGSLYTLLTSIPAKYPTKDNGNYWFQSIEKFKIPTLGKILSHAGYKSVYLMSTPEVSGTEYLLKANYFEVVSEKNNLGYFKSTHDLDLFNEAKQQVLKLNSKNKPFALFISTIDTHFPKGKFDKNMQNILNKQYADYDNPINFSIESVDYLIGDFINYLKSLNMFENTIFMIVPDHRMMGRGGGHFDKIIDINSDRDLFLLTNASIKTNEIKQTTLPRLIIDAAEINTNATFISDYDENIKNKINIAQLNKAIVVKENWVNNLNFTIKNNLLSIKPSKGFIHELQIPKKVKNINLIFNSNFEFLDSKINTTIPFKHDWIKDPIQLTLYFENQELQKYYLGNYNDAGFYKKVKNNKFVVKKSDIKLIMKSNNFKNNEVKVQSKQISSKAWINIQSSSRWALNAGLPSYVRVADKSFKIQRGINVVYIKNTELVSENFDTYGSQKSFEELIKKIDKLKNSNNAFILVSSDAIRNNWSNNKFINTLVKNKLTTLSNLNGRFAYIAYFDGINTQEFSDKDSLYITIPNLKKIIDYKKIIQDRNKFIAHAGGEINGKRYTNSLEALNNSYQNGLRLFELDIIKTSDGHFVAAHDWKNWKSKVNYPDKDKQPVSLDEFLKNKIVNKYTPMSMNEINSWFSKHTDAILVTDKVNSPIEFSNLFVDKKRLMMELFSVEAVKEGIQAQILESIPTGGLWEKIKNNNEILKNIRFIAAGRKISKSIVREIQNKKLKIYAFHLNFEKHATEIWSICNESDLFYGFYVDKTDFLNQSINCKNY